MLLMYPSPSAAVYLSLMLICTLPLCCYVALPYVAMYPDLHWYVPLPYVAMYPSPMLLHTLPLLLLCIPPLCCYVSSPYVAMYLPLFCYVSLPLCCYMQYSPYFLANPLLPILILNIPTHTPSLPSSSPLLLPFSFPLISATSPSCLTSALYTYMVSTSLLMGTTNRKFRRNFHIGFDPDYECH